MVWPLSNLHYYYKWELCAMINYTLEEDKIEFLCHCIYKITENTKKSAICGLQTVYKGPMFSEKLSMGPQFMA